MSLEPTNRDDDCFAPPAIPTEVCCLHCQRSYESYLIEWRVEKKKDGGAQGFWCCATPGCGGVGFGCDLLPTDPTYQDEHGGWVHDSDSEDDEDFDNDDEWTEDDTGEKEDRDKRPPDENVPWWLGGLRNLQETDVPSFNGAAAAEHQGQRRRPGLKTILCYGDSLTWGFDAATGARTPFEKRWPNVTQAQLGNGYRVIEEALNGRTTVFDDAFMPDRNGRTMLPALLDSHRPLDLVMVLLGTNDLQPYRKLTAAEVTRGAAALLDVIVKSGAGPNNGAPQMLLISPPPLGTAAGFMAPIFAGAEAESGKLAGLYQLAAQFYGCHFFDAGGVVSACKTDGVHLDESAQRKLGEEMAGVVKKVLA